jgi:hypothetical protein
MKKSLASPESKPLYKYDCLQTCLYKMRMKFNPLIQSAVWYFAWRVAVAHPGFPPTGHADGLGAFGLHSGQGDLFEVVSRATSLKRKRPAEGDPVDARMSCSVNPYLEYSSGMSFHPTTHYPDHISGSQSKIQFLLI